MLSECEDSLGNATSCDPLPVTHFLCTTSCAPLLFQDLIQLICNIQAMEDTVVEMKFDTKKAPLGRLTLGTFCEVVVGKGALPPPLPAPRQADSGADYGRVQCTEED